MNSSPESSFLEVSKESVIYIIEQLLFSDWYSKQLDQLKNDLEDADDDEYRRASLLYDFSTLMQEVFLTASDMAGECCAGLTALETIK